MKQPPIKFTKKDKINILTRYFVYNVQMIAIHLEYKDRCSIGFFSQKVALWMIDPELINEIFKIDKKRPYFTTSEPAMVSEPRQYYPNGLEDMYYTCITKKDLSPSEKRLYNEIS